MNEIDSDIQVTVISNNMQQVSEEPLIAPQKALLLGPCGVLPKELSNVTCNSIDIVLPSHKRAYQNLINDVIAETFGSKAPITAFRSGQRLLPDYTSIPMPESIEPCTKESGVYVITGGLGGIGFVLAKHLIKTASARLVVFGRTKLPEEKSWDSWIEEHPTDNPISIQIRKLQTLKAMGGKILSLSADVTDFEAVQLAAKTVRNTFGVIDGIFHTAGVINDGLSSIKSKQDSTSVLLPKVQGTLILDKVFEQDNLDFFLLFSSTSSILGLEGQIDYTAANNFLDAFARYKRGKDGTPTCSINWGRWDNVGMGARIAGNETLFESDVLLANSLFERYRQTSNKTEYFMSLSPVSDWILSEHRTKSGVALLPGTSYLSLTHAAYNCNDVAFQPIELIDVHFLEPFTLGDDKNKELVISVEPGTDMLYQDVSITSSYDGTNFIEHAHGRLKTHDEVVARYPIQTIVEQCRDTVITTDTAEHEHMSFGNRWNNVQSLSIGQEQAIVKMYLSDEYITDLEKFPLHPALLDMATGNAQSLIPGYDAQRDFYIPFSYGSCKVYKPLERSLYSHIRISPNTESAAEFASFDITVTDENGIVLIDIAQFMMKRLNSGVFNNLADTKSSNPISLSTRDPDEATGIQPDEGMKALDLILGHACYPQIIVSPVSVTALAKSNQKFDSDASSDVISHDRPDLSIPYVEPRNEIESSIAQIWERALGLSPVGINDNFFDLGGHSLLLTQTVSKIRKILNVRLPLSKVFEQPNIADWAGLIDSSDTSAPIKNEQGLVTGTIPLTPALHRYLNERKSPDPHHWNISIMLQSSRPLSSDALSKSINKLLEQHDVLRAKFEVDENGVWTAFNNSATKETSYTKFDLSNMPAIEQSAKIEELSVIAQSSFDLKEGQLFSVTHFHLGDGLLDRLLIVVHHFVADALSWTILLEDFQTIYNHHCNSLTPPVIEKSTSYKCWAEDMVAKAQSSSVQSSTSFWLTQPWSSIKPLPIDSPKEIFCNTNLSAEQYIVNLDKLETKELLLSLPSEIQIEYVMLSALCRAVGYWTESPYAHIDVMRHGRDENEGIELSRAVGFFISYVPLVTPTQLSSSFSDSLTEMVRIIKNMLERGDQYDLLRFLSNDSEIKQEMAALPMPEILFNYIGHRNEDNNAVIDQNIFEIAPESSGPTHSPQGIRQHAIAVKCGIIDNELTYTIVYSKNLHDKSTIKMIGSQLLSELRSLSVPSINIQDLYQTSSKSRNNSTPSRLNLNGNNNLNDFT